MSEYEYDLIVIGGGSGGMAAAKEAAKHGAKVALFDFVKPSTQGTKWGLGGTCVNVGCVPKKLMHYAGLIGHNFYDAREYGWKLPETLEHDWSKLVQTVQNYVKSLNFGYRTGLRSNNVNYINALATFSGDHTVKYTLKGEEKTTTAARFLIAVGGRPAIPDDVEGAKENAISSDDIFAMKKCPGKTLCVGGSYISLECGGFLHELGLPVTIAVRSILLRGFDRQCAEKIGENMEAMGVNFRTGVIPTKLVKDAEGKIHVTFNDGSEDTFDTVLYATGRGADTGGLGLEAVGVKTLPSGKIEGNNEQTNVDYIYAVGDVLEGVPELTPAAIQAGELLARRLYAGASELMDYKTIPTTVFTPYEYGCVGYSEEDAEAKYGKENIETYLFSFTSLEHSAVHRKKHPSRYENTMDADFPTANLSKLVCLKTENERVIGFHFVGPNAGEVTQGFALAVLCGATKQQFTKMVGIHPTDAESFTTMDITRASGENFVAAGGCGGGKCG